MQEQETHPLKWLLSQCKSHRWMLWTAVVFSVLATTLSLGSYYVIYLIIDQLLSATSENNIWIFAFAALAMMLVRYFCLLLSVYLAHHSAFHVQYQVRMNALKKLSQLPLGFFSRKTSGELKKNVTEDIERIEVFIAHQIPDLVSSLVLPIATFVLMLMIDYRMALVALLPIPLAMVCQAMLFRDYQSQAEQYHQSIEKLNTSVTEFAKAMPVIRLFGIGEHSYGQLSKQIGAHQVYIKCWTERSAWPYAWFKTVLNSGLLFLVPVGIYFWAQGTLSIASFVLCLLLGVGMLEPLFNLALVSTYLGQILEGVKRLMAILSLPGRCAERATVELKHHSVCFDRVEFCYDGKTKNALESMSFSLPTGSVTALVGPSGAGKSTVAALMAGFWTLEKGQITIGDVPVNQIPETQLMDNIAMVYQDSFLFEQSIWFNITMGHDYPGQAVVAAARAANADGFIRQLPNGYQTVVGKSLRLSGGEKQRIAIARAILKDAPIIILDEPTAHSDPTSQRLIQAALSQLIVGKTVLIIAHRLSTIQNADNILVLQEGRLVEQGKHADLLGQQGLYASLWLTHQTANETSDPQPCQEVHYV